MVAAASARRADRAPMRATWLERNLPSLSSVKRLELMVFSRQMATFIRAGIPILDGIRVVQEQASSGLFRRTLDAVARDLLEGEPLSRAMARHPRVFSTLYVDLVRAAEASGQLDAVLDQLARYLQHSETSARRLRQATMYPSIVLGLAVVVVFVLTTFVLPAYVTLFADFQAELPLPTQVLLGLGSFGGRYGTLSAAVVGIVGVFAYLMRGVGWVRRLRDRLALRLPVVGGVLRLGIASRWARTLGILLRAGVAIDEAMAITAQGTGNHVFRKRLQAVRERVVEGEGLAAQLAASRLFGPLLVQMVKVGEETGTLDAYLEQAADFMDDDLDYRTKQMVTVIEPALIVGVALVVGFVALSVVTPMYGILRQIR